MSTQTNNPDMKMIVDYFPDSVDIQLLSERYILELEWNTEKQVALNVTDGDPDHVTELKLKELEP